MNLIEKYSGSNIESEFEVTIPWVIGFSESNEKLGLNKGDVVTFWSGHNGDIQYTSKILGFDKHGFAYMLWDCYWCAIDLEKRLISK